MQQIIYLSICKKSAIFYKCRFSVFNFTVCGIAIKRDSTEIATCVFKDISEYINKSVKSIQLYSDGYYGQNKNSIMAFMLLYALHKNTTIQEISLIFFGTNHGQNEGDSVHSAINYTQVIFSFYRCIIP